MSWREPTQGDVSLYACLKKAGCGWGQQQHKNHVCVCSLNEKHTYFLKDVCVYVHTLHVGNWNTINFIWNIINIGTYYIIFYICYIIYNTLHFPPFHLKNASPYTIVVNLQYPLPSHLYLLHSCNIVA